MSVLMDHGDKTWALLNVVFLHITVKVPTSDWWWIALQLVLRVFPEPATYCTRHPHCYANHGEHCSGNITKDLSAPFSSSSPGSCFTGNAQGVMRHVPLFKGCFGYIRDFPFSFFFICCIFICLSVWVELHLLQFGLVPLREAAELTVIHCTTQTYNFNVISRIPDLFWSQR